MNGKRSGHYMCIISAQSTTTRAAACNVSHIQVERFNRRSVRHCWDERTVCVNLERVRTRQM